MKRAYYLIEYFLIICCFLFSFAEVTAQKKVASKAISYNASEKKQLNKADELIMRAENIYSDITSKEAGRESSSSDGLFSKYGQKERNKDLQESYLRAISMYYAGYSKKSKVIKERTERFKKEEEVDSERFNALFNSYDKKAKQAAAAYRKSRSIGSLDEAIRLGEKAIDIHKSIQADMLSAMVVKPVQTEELVVQEESVIQEEQEELVKSETTEEVSSETVISEATETETIKKAPVVAVASVPVLAKTVETDEVYYSIQVLADKEKVTDEQLRKAYNGELDIYVNYGDSWYRYSVGKFDSYNNAIQAMRSNNLQGHPVAYHGKKRISLVEASKLVGEESKKDIVKTEPIPVVKEEKSKTAKTYFTIQLMADRKKASADQVKRIYSGSLKVDENIGDGWYRYSIGQFSSYEQANATMKKEGVKGYIVAYHQGKRISVSEAKQLLSK